MRGRPCPEAWACRLLAKEPPVPERIGSKVLPIPTKSPLSLWSQLEALGEKQEPPRIYAGEVSGSDLRAVYHVMQHLNKKPFEANTSKGTTGYTRYLAHSLLIRPRWTAYSPPYRSSGSNSSSSSMSSSSS